MTVLLISAVVFGTLFSLTVQAHYVLFWPVLFGVLLLAIRSQLTWPERMARSGDYVAAGAEFDELIDGIRRLARSMRLPRVPVLLIGPESEGLAVFGTWRRWYIACGEDHARRLLAAYRREETRDDVLAALIHELHHFGMRDHLWIGHARATLVASSVVLAWTAVFVLGAIALTVSAGDYLMTHAPSDMVTQQREMWTQLGMDQPAFELPAGWVDELYGLEARRDEFRRMDPLLTALRTLLNTLPLVLIGVLLLRFYWRATLRAREHYADIGAAASVGSVAPVVRALVSLAPSRSGARSGGQEPRRRRLSLAPIFGLDDAAHPSPMERLAVLKDPLALFGKPYRTALETGLFLLVMDAFFRLSSAAAIDLQWPRSFPAVAAYLLIGVQLLARVAGGRARYREALGMTAVALLPLAAARLLGLILLGPILVAAHHTEHGAVRTLVVVASRYTGTGATEALSVGPAGYLVGLVLPRLAELIGLGLATGLAVATATYLFGRLFTWYRHPDARRAVVRGARVVLFCGAAGLALALMPALCHLVDWRLPSVGWFVVSLLLGTAVTGLGIGWIALGQLRHGGRCPACGAGIPGDHLPGRACSGCGTLQHPWLLIRYEVNP